MIFKKIYQFISDYRDLFKILVALPFVILAVYTLIQDIKKSKLPDKYFNDSIQYVLEHEGGYSDHPIDKGGKTKYGIAQNFHPTVDVKNLTLEEAKEIYRQKYWLPYYNHIRDKTICMKLFDASVLMGTHKAALLLQRALLATGVDVTLDGDFGKKTLKLVNECCNPEGLLWAFTGELSAYLTDIADVDPSQRVFLQGWMNRVYDQP